MCRIFLSFIIVSSFCYFILFFDFLLSHYMKLYLMTQSSGLDLSDLNESWCKLSPCGLRQAGQQGKIAQLIKISISTFPL